MKKLRILLLVHEDFVPPDSIDGLSEKEVEPFKTEYDVQFTLRELGHEVQPVGVSSELSVLRSAINEFKPDIVFNLLEEFRESGHYVQNVIQYLELLGVAYTGCNARGLFVACEKPLSKQVLSYHRVHTPRFVVFRIGRMVRRPKRLSFPLLVKSAVEQGSVGIARQSVVYDDAKLLDRVRFVHEQVGTDALVEEYIDGRELYVGVMGNQRLQTLPIWEMIFNKLPEGAPRIATYKIKWDLQYQEKIGLDTRAAVDLSEEMRRRIERLCKRVYRMLLLSGYARLDLRLTPEGKIHVLEANPNPQLAYDEDFAESAHSAGLTYERLLQRIVNLGLTYPKSSHWR